MLEDEGRDIGGGAHPYFRLRDPSRAEPNPTSFARTIL